MATHECTLSVEGNVADTALPRSGTMPQRQDSTRLWCSQGHTPQACKEVLPHKCVYAYIKSMCIHMVCTRRRQYMHNQSTPYICQARPTGCWQHIILHDSPSNNATTLGEAFGVLLFFPAAHCHASRLAPPALQTSAMRVGCITPSVV